MPTVATETVKRHKFNGYAVRYRNAKAITVADFEKMLAKHPYCADPTKPEYARYKRVLCKAIAIGTKAVKAKAEKRLTMLDRVVNGYTGTISTTLNKTREHRAFEGPHTKGQQCKPVWNYRYPDTDSGALRLDKDR